MEKGEWLGMKEMTMKAIMISIKPRLSGLRLKMVLLLKMNWIHIAESKLKSMKSGCPKKIMAGLGRLRKEN